VPIEDKSVEVGDLFGRLDAIGGLFRVDSGNSRTFENRLQTLWGEFACLLR
jgi:hypothetical protein